MFDAKNKKRCRRSLFLTVLLIGGGIAVSIVSGCNQNQPTTNPINQKTVNFSSGTQKKISSGKIKSRNVSPGKKKPAAVTTIQNSATKQKKMRNKPFYTSKIANLRDPFLPFINFSEETEKKRKKNRPLLPLQRYTLSQLKLIAIIDAGNTKKWAMVQDASGKGYILKKGMFVGSEGGIVKNIIRDKVIIQQNFVDVFGKKKKKIAVMKLHPEKRGE